MGAVIFSFVRALADVMFSARFALWIPVAFVPVVSLDNVVLVSILIAGILTFPMMVVELPFGEFTWANAEKLGKYSFKGLTKS
jgi:hypothetical protein